MVPEDRLEEDADAVEVAQLVGDSLSRGRLRIVANDRYNIIRAQHRGTCHIEFVSVSSRRLTLYNSAKVGFAMWIFVSYLVCVCHLICRGAYHAKNTSTSLLNLRCTRDTCALYM